LGQLGTTISTYSFEKNGTCNISVKFIEAEIAEMKTGGTYKVIGEGLIIDLNGKTKNYYISFEEELLILESENEIMRLYRFE
jgi:hypothetical protein